MKAFSPISVIVPSATTVVSEVQPENIPSGIKVTDAGRTVLSRDVQSEK